METLHSSHRQLLSPTGIVSVLCSIGTTSSREKEDFRNFLSFVIHLSMVFHQKERFNKLEA